MKYRLLTLAAVIFGTTFAATSDTQIPTMRFTVHVVGEDRGPIPDVQATFLFNESAVGFGKKTKVPVVTDHNGYVTVEGYSEEGTAILDQSFIKSGYYESGIPMPNFETIKDDRWLPWGQTYITVLRKIGTPIPLYARKVSVRIPASQVSLGYDLEKGDWVGPPGSGKVADFVVTVTNLQFRSSNDSNVSAVISFSNDGDGIQEVTLPKEFSNSMFTWPRTAPETGYKARLEARRLWLNVRGKDTQNIVTYNENQAHFFRVRTVKEGGQIVSAIYGKIKGGIGIDPGDGKTAILYLTYYLNPTPNDRNLEFSGNSLFEHLPFEETTHVP